MEVAGAHTNHLLLLACPFYASARKELARRLLPVEGHCSLDLPPGGTVSRTAHRATVTVPRTGPGASNSGHPYVRWIWFYPGRNIGGELACFDVPRAVCETAMRDIEHREHY